MWNCPKCKTSVDDEFELCWSCGTSIEGVEDPEFVTADDAGPIIDPVDDLSQFEPDDSLDDFAGIPIPDLTACYEASGTIEAKFIADRLLEAGIPAVADTHNINHVLGGFQPTMWGYGPKIRVRPKDLPNALAWIETYKNRRAQREADSDEDDTDSPN